MKKKVKKDTKKVNKKNHHSIFNTSKTIGQKAADNLTKWAGSWLFIFIFLGFLALWMYINAKTLGRPFDPFPFILLNLILSCLAALQAPIILMSQNRTTQRDRLRSDYDYAINRKAEREINQIKKQLDRIERVMSRRRKPIK